MIAGPARISILGLKVFAYHGCTREEKERGQTFAIDIDLEHDVSGAIEGDDLGLTIDYDRVVSEVHEMASSERYDLIETLAARIGEYLLASTGCRRAVVRVRKPEAPLRHEVKEVSVEIAFENE